MEEVHLFILWENARDKQDVILEDIKENFNIIGLYNISWSKEKFSEELSRFYGTNLPKNSGKEQHCGNGDFLLVVVKVTNPKYEKRETSKGIQIVNIDMFDKKTYYRELTGGGHKVHATNSEAETNHDLTLLLGKNVEDYLKEVEQKNNNNLEIINYKNDIIGTNGFDTVSEMFYALNNCVNYAIIRNYEQLPEEIYINEHNDIDIICDSLENTAYILNAEKVFEEDYRVHYKVNVESNFAFFDLRCIGDDYYCEQMEKDILENRIYNQKGFYTISNEEYFYGLIYHALLHKPNFAKDYKLRLQKINPTGIELEKKEDFVNILNEWLLENDYAITKPIDLSVQFNLENAKIFDKIVEEDTNKIYQNSKLRKNILHWYPIKEKSDILQIGYDSIKVVEELCDKSQTVTLIVNNEKQKEEIYKKMSRDNLKIELSRDLMINDDKEYDYVTLIGTIEIYKEICEYNAYARLEKILNIAKSKCKQNGKILLAIDNKFGIKFWTSLDAQNNILCNGDKAISKSSIDELLNKTGLISYKYYYPLPDYKITNVIFTDEYLPDLDNIHRDFTYGKEEFISYNHTEAFEQILKEDSEKFPFFANSYFIEIAKNELEESHIRFVSYTNIRKERYKIQTIIYEDRVEKTNINGQSKRHIENIKRNIDILKKRNIKTLDTYQGNIIISKYIKDSKTYDKILLELLKNKNQDKFMKTIIEYKNILLKNLPKADFKEIRDNNIFTKYKIEGQGDIFNKLHFVKYGLYDMIFQNCFVIENELYYYDQEWYEDNVPVEFIIYRSILYCPSIHEYVKVDNLYKELHLKEYIEIFQKLEEKIQHKIRNESIWKMHNYTKTGQTLIDLYNNLQNETDSYKLELNNYKMKYENRLKYIEELENKINASEQERQIILNSKSWKVTKPMRWIFRNIKENRRKH